MSKRQTRKSTAARKPSKITVLKKRKVPVLNIAVVSEQPPLNPPIVEDGKMPVLAITVTHEAEPLKPLNLPTVGSVIEEEIKVVAKIRAQYIKREIQWPANWWEAIKDRFFPTWAKKQWPVIYAEHVWFESPPENS